MPEFGPNMPVPQAIQSVAGFAIAALILRIVVAILAAIWIFRDAESRGKHGLAAALLALLSGFYGMPLTVMVLCAWVLIRPERVRRDVSEERLPDKLSPEIHAAPSSEEFLEELREQS